MSAGQQRQPMAQGEFIPRREARSHGDRMVLWLSVLTGLTAWVAALALDWILSPSAVHHDSALRLLIVNVVAAVIALGAAVLSWQRWRSPAHDDPTGTTATRETDRFMAELGLGSSLLFLVFIIAQSAAIFFVGPGL